MPKKSATGPRAATLNVRIPEKTRWGLDLQSRVHRESIADLVIRAIDNAFESHDTTGSRTSPPHETSVVDLLAATWAERESDRLANLAFAAPDLLTGAERRLWQTIETDDQLWTTPERCLATLNREALAAKLENPQPSA